MPIKKQNKNSRTRRQASFAVRRIANRNPRGLLRKIRHRQFARGFGVFLFLGIIFVTTFFSFQENDVVSGVALKSSSTTTVCGTNATCKDGVAWTGCGAGLTEYPWGNSICASKLCCGKYGQSEERCGEVGENAVCKKSETLFGGCPDGWESSGAGGRDCDSGMICCVRSGTTTLKTVGTSSPLSGSSGVSVPSFNPGSASADPSDLTGLVGGIGDTTLGEGGVSDDDLFGSSSPVSSFTETLGEGGVSNDDLSGGDGSSASSFMETLSNTNISATGEDWWVNIGDSGAVLNGPGATQGLQEFKFTYRGNKYGSAIGMITGWTNFVMPFISVLAIAALVYAGFLYITAAGNDEQVSKAKNIIIWVVIGIVLIYSAYAIVNTFISGDSSQ